MRRRLLATAVVFAAVHAVACASGPRPQVVTEGGDVEDARKHARETIEEIYQSLRRGSAEGILPLLAEELFVAGPGVGDIFLNRNDAVVALANVIDAGRKHRLRSRSLRVVPSPTGRSAWAADQIELEGTAYTIIAVLARIDDLWFATAVHIARPVPDKKVAQLVAAGQLPRPAPLAGDIDDDARPFADRFQRGTGARAQLLDQLADRRDALAVGSAPREITLGAKAIRKRWQKSLAKKPTMAVQGEVRARVTPDRGLGWVCANVDLGATDHAVPHRSFYVYERSNEVWQLVAAQESVVVPSR